MYSTRIPDNPQVQYVPHSQLSMDPGQQYTIRFLLGEYSPFVEVVMKMIASCNTHTIHNRFMTSISSYSIPFICFQKLDSQMERTQLTSLIDSVKEFIDSKQELILECYKPLS